MNPRYEAPLAVSRHGEPIQGKGRGSRWRHSVSTSGGSAGIAPFRRPANAAEAQQLLNGWWKRLADHRTAVSAVQVAGAGTLPARSRFRRS